MPAETTTADGAIGAKSGEVSVGRIVLASLVGTTIEFYDFYIYGTAAALVIGQTFFPQSAPGAQALNAFLTFGIAFLARPIGSILFGHYGDRLGRKATLVASMLTMGLSTTLIGALPSYAQAGALAPWLLCVLRFCQGVGLGGEWGGAALLATEYAPRGKRAWFGMFPQLGPPLGFLMANGLFLLLLLALGEKAFIAWAWRVPFLLSAVLVAIGLYVRASIAETPAFRAAMARHERRPVPLVDLLRDHWLPLILGSLSIVVCYALFYVSTVFALRYSVATQHIAQTDFLAMLCVAVLFMAATTPISAAFADRYGRRAVLLAASVLAMGVGLAMAPLLNGGAFASLAFLSLALGVMGLTFAPLGALLPELFPTPVRYTGASSAYNLGGILGASLAPYMAQKLLELGGLAWVGYYIVAAAAVSFLSLLAMKETGRDDMRA
ncbi:MAG: MHS family MFS transporter [Hyphomicrobiales bacterium]|nr:MHS family MFS transporter [Hyphomicrobiales bacterium]